MRVSPKNTTGCPYRALIIHGDTVICLQGYKLITGGGLISCRFQATARSKEWEPVIRSALTRDLKREHAASIVFLGMRNVPVIT